MGDIFLPPMVAVEGRAASVNSLATLPRYGRWMHTIHNARIQLLATALNNLGVGATITGIVAPLVNGAVGDPIHIGLWFALGADLVAMAQVILGRLR